AGMGDRPRRLLAPRRAVLGEGDGSAAGRRAAAGLLAQPVAELDAFDLVAGRVGIREVARDHVQHALLRDKAGCGDAVGQVHGSSAASRVPARRPRPRARFSRCGRQLFPSGRSCPARGKDSLTLPWQLAPRQGAHMSGAATAEQTNQEPAAPEKPSGRRKLILLAAPLALAGLLAGLWFSGLLPRWLGLSHPPPPVAEKAPEPIYIDLPEMVANLNGNPRRPSYVKLLARIEISRPEDADRVRQAI